MFHNNNSIAANKLGFPFDPLHLSICICRLALEVQTWYREQLEREPVRFMETAGLAALVTAVADVAHFVGADWRDVVPVTNATTGVNAVLQSLKLQKGDLILMTNGTYAAVRAVEVIC
jgi:isopenicillin-N epimerase